MDEQTIKKIVKETLKTVKTWGWLRDSSEIEYIEAANLLIGFFKKTETSEEIKNAVERLKVDPYFDILPMYFEKNMSLSKIADVLGVEPSTVARNKKRLCTLFYRQISK